MTRPARHLPFRLLVFFTVCFQGLGPALAQDPPPELESGTEEIISIETLDTETGEAPDPAPSSLDLSNLREGLRRLEEQMTNLEAGQGRLERRQEAVLAEIQALPEPAPTPQVNLTPLVRELNELRQSVESMEPITAADEVVFEDAPDPYTDKIFILNILLLVLLSVLIFLQLFFKGKAGGRPRVSAPGKKELEGIFQAIQQVSDQTKALQATVGKASPTQASTPAPDLRESMDAAMAPLLRTLNEHSSTEALQSRLETFQDALVSQDQKLSLLQDGFQRLEQSAGAANEANQRIQELEQESARLKQELESNRQSLAEQKAFQENQSAGLEDTLQKTNALFPEWIQGDGPLEAIHAVLKDRIAESQSATARSFLGQALQLDGVLSAGDTSRKELASVLANASQAGYQFLLRDMGYDKDQVRKTMRTWIANLDKSLSAQTAHLRLSQVFPGDSFQLATMEAVDSISGNRLTVDQPLSWLIEDTAESPPRVLQRAKVVTA